MGRGTVPAIFILFSLLVLSLSQCWALGSRKGSRANASFSIWKHNYNFLLTVIASLFNTTPLATPPLGQKPKHPLSPWDIRACFGRPHGIIHFSEEGDTTPTPGLSLPSFLSPPPPSKLLTPGSCYATDHPLKQTTSKVAQAQLPTTISQ